MAKERTKALVRRLLRGTGLVLTGLVLWGSVAPIWAAPTAPQMLGYRPRQEGINYTTPEPQTVSSCTVELVKGQAKGSGWLLKDGGKQPLRLFFDTNGDNKVDVWAYYQNGVEVYREIDTNFTGKPDQYRWLNSGGSKWGLDAAQEGKVTSWKVISPEEVTQEVIQALTRKDYSRFEALLITETEIKDLNLPSDMATKIRESRKGAPEKFKEATKLASLANGKAVWLNMESKKTPSTIPADQIGTRYDLVKHPGIAIRYTEPGNNKVDTLQTSELIQVGLAWRLIDAPGPDEGDGGGPPTSPELMKLIEELANLDKNAPVSTVGTNSAVMQHHLRRADLLEKIVGLSAPSAREPWIRQVADSLSTAAQASAKGETTAMTRLLSLENQLAAKMPGSNLAAYVTFREMQTEYSIKISEEKDFTKVQTVWLERLSKFIQTYPKAEDTPDALLQAGMVSEFLDKETEAENWYNQLLKNFPDKPQAAKAEGAIRRLKSEGKPFTLVGPLLHDPNQVFDIESLTKQGKVVIVYYWAAWNTQSVGDFAKLKVLLDTFKGVELVCVNLDNTPEEAKAFLTKSPAPGTHLYQPGGLDSKLASYYGVQVLPNTFVIDRDGKMANRKIQINSLDEEIKKRVQK